LSPWKTKCVKRRIKKDYKYETCKSLDLTLSRFEKDVLQCGVAELNLGDRLLQKMGCATEDYDAIYQQALIEMQLPDFRATWPLVTVWGTKLSHTPAD